MEIKQTNCAGLTNFYLACGDTILAELSVWVYKVQASIYIMAVQAPHNIDVQTLTKAMDVITEMCNIANQMNTGTNTTTDVIAARLSAALAETG